jgi:hypothetical protein
VNDKLNQLITERRNTPDDVVEVVVVEELVEVLVDVLVDVENEVVIY